MRNITRTWVVSIGVMALLAIGIACAGGTETAPEAAQQPAVAAPVAAEPTAAAAEQMASPEPAMAEKAKYGGVFRSATRRDPPGAWDPLKTNNYDLAVASQPVYGTGHLVRLCRDDIYKICPGLAESWEQSADFTQWTFKIRDNVVWHDGTPFTVEDAKYWLDLVNFGFTAGDKARGPAFFRAEFGDVTAIDVLDGNRVRISLKDPAPQYLNSITNPQRTIAHPTHLMKPRMEQGEVNVAPQDVEWVAMGPFKMTGHEKGVRSEAQRFDQYWEKDEGGQQLPYMDGVIFAFIQDASSMDAAFRSGQLDSGARGAGYYLTPERESRYVADLGDGVWFGRIGGGRSGLAFNTLKEGPLQDVRVRKAISLWVDRQQAIQAIYSGSGHLVTLLAPENPFTNPDFRTWPGWNPETKAQDRAEAMRLLQEAGHTERFTLSLICPNRWLNTCEFTHAQLGGLGIDVDINIVDEAGWSAGRLTLNNDIQIGGGAGTDTIPESAEDALTTYSTSNFAPAKHEDPKVVETFRQLNSTSSLEERVRIWREFERYLLLERVYLAPAFGQLAVVPYRSEVKGLPIPPEGVMNSQDHATTWLDR